VIRNLCTALAIAPEAIEEFREIVWLPDTAAAVERER
jgi:hypothetical protein